MILVIDDPLVRDQILVGVQHCNGVEVESLKTASALEAVRAGTCDCIMLACDPAQPETLERLHEFREANSQIELVVVTDGRSAKQLAKEKAELGYDSILQVPILADAFFRLMGRMAPRLALKRKRRTSSPAR